MEKEKYISSLRRHGNDGGSALQEKNTSMEIILEDEDTSATVEVDLTLEKLLEKSKPSAAIIENKSKQKKFKLKKNRGEKRKFPEKSDPKKIKRKKKEEKTGIQIEQNEILPVTSQSKPVLKKEGSTSAENDSDVEIAEKTKQKSCRKSKVIANKCKDTLHVLLKLDSDVLESMDKSLKIIKSHSLLSDKYISVDVLLDLISLALERRGEAFQDSSLSLIVSKYLDAACVTPKQLKVRQSLSNRSFSISPKNKSFQEEVLPKTPTSKEEVIVKETSKNKNLEEREQIESEVFEKVQEKSGKNFCITNYFKKLKKTVEERDKNERFSCFSTKTDMFLAPKLGGELVGERRRQFEEELSSQQCESNYLSERSCKRKCIKFTNAREENAKEYFNAIEGGTGNAGEAKARVSLIKVDRSKIEAVGRAKAKLFQFHDNRRPPYWGTWRRKSETVGPRKPFGRDKAFNYEVDSDDEWEEEEEPGESLHGSDDEKEPEEDYEVDNDFFVPHGYLSDDENPEKENMSPKTKLDLLEEQFSSEIKQKARKMTPIVFGTFWAHETLPREGNLYQDLQIEKLQYVPWTATPVEIEEEEDKKNENFPEEPISQVKKSKQKIFPSEEIPNLIKMIHGSPQNSDHLARKFLLYWETEKIPNGNRPGLTKVCVQKKIKELAAWQASHEKGKMCWQVPKETREEFGAQVENKTPEKKPRKCFIWKFVRKAEKNPTGVGDPSSAPPPPPTPAVEPEVIILET